jgi:nucleoside-diphosphate-sugar epimerase
LQRVSTLGHLTVVSDAPLVILGCGFTGTAAARLALARGMDVIATTRDPTRAASLRALGVVVHVLPTLDGTSTRAIVREGARVLAAFPPDGRTDAVVTRALPATTRCVYLSTTGVYGAHRGIVDLQTPVDPSAPRAAPRLAAEAHWLAVGAVVLRAAGIYGPGRGLHRRLRERSFRLPDDVTKVVSRIHVDDLALLCLAALESSLRGVVFPVADDAPVPQAQVVQWLIERMGVPPPEPIATADAPETLRHDRSVDNRAVKAALGVTLRFPTYREGFEDCLARDP